MVSLHLKVNSDNVILIDLGWNFDHEHVHISLPDLKWVSADNRENISREIASFVAENCWDACSRIPGSGDQELLSRIHEFDFRYTGHLTGLVQLANWLYKRVKFVCVLTISHD